MGRRIFQLGKGTFILLPIRAFILESKRSALERHGLLTHVLSIVSVQVDIIHDRFGFYIFWGCTAFLPSIYTLTSLYLTTHPRDLPWSIAVLILLCGLASVYVNYDTDRQRQYFRATNGKCTIWGKAPRIIHAKYTTGDGESRNSILLASGWWGIARHVNYVFEIALAVAWSLPAGMAAFIPYIYVSFLTILLVDRAYRDELRCKDKYGRYYQMYCDQVPYKMIPGVY